MSVLDCLGTFVGHILLLIAYTTWSIRHFSDFKFQTLTMQNHFKSGLFWARRPQCNFVTNGLTRTVYHNIKIQWLLQKNDQVYPNMKKHVKQPWSNSIVDNHSIYSNRFEYQFPHRLRSSSFNLESQASSDPRKQTRFRQICWSENCSCLWIQPQKTIPGSNCATVTEIYST